MRRFRLRTFVVVAATTVLAAGFTLANSGTASAAGWTQTSQAGTSSGTTTVNVSYKFDQHISKSFSSSTATSAASQAAVSGDRSWNGSNGNSWGKGTVGVQAANSGAKTTTVTYGYKFDQHITKSFSYSSTTASAGKTQSKVQSTWPHQVDNDNNYGQSDDDDEDEGDDDDYEDYDDEEDDDGLLGLDLDIDVL